MSLTTRLRTMSPSTVLTEAVGKPLKRAGFKKESDGWYVNSDESITVINRQKSSFGPQYYINIGVWLKCIGEADLPKTHKCHIQFRWGALIPQDEKQLERLLDLDNESISDQERVREVGNLLETYILPFVSSAISLHGLRMLYKSDGWPVCLVNVKAQEILKDGM